MTDRETVELFLKREECSIETARSAYGAYCVSLAKNILGDQRDAEECFADALGAAWNSIPPEEPKSLGAYLAKLTRNLALDAWKRRNAQKRGGGSMPLPLDEDIALSTLPGPEDALCEAELIDAINGYLASQPERRRVIFTMRYFRYDRVADIAKAVNSSSGSVGAVLRRMRKELENYLKERGFDL